MDPVAMQFLAQLDACGEDLPESVLSGLLMCGDDATPGLVERALDPARPLASRAHATHVLGRLGDDDALDALVAVVLSGEAALMRAAKPGLIAAGPAAADRLLARAADVELPPSARCVLAALALRAGADPARVEPVAVEAFPEAPRAAMDLMRMAPRQGYRAALLANREVLHRVADDAVELLVALTPAADPQEVAFSQAVVQGLKSAL